jgi:photosystem II stability/assembly factor-like uncharacterized protein
VQSAAPAASPEEGNTSRAMGQRTAGKAVVSVEPQSEVLRNAANVITPRWTLSTDGRMLMRSVDSGKTWQTIPVASKVVFRAVSAVGPEVWAGGPSGALYHSADSGQHWVQVRPLADGQALAADIVHIEFSDAQHGRLTTANREVWTTNDAGRSWQKQ